MADIVDDANERVQNFLDAALAKVPKPKKIIGIGVCLNCGEAVDGERRWCDATCCAEWERYTR